MRRPIVLVPACSHEIGPHPSYAAQNKYVDAVAVGARCQPLLVPPLGDSTDIESLLSVANGIMLTGAASNVQARLYGQETLDPSLPQDIARDATALPLVRAALLRGIPLLAICRGFQEVNVALGGTLHQSVHTVSGYFDHREDKTQSLEQQYGPAHRIKLEPGGLLAHILDGAGEIQVNSLHGQGIDRLAPGLQVEARSDDGLIEAYSVAASSAFALAVQWHPEWRVEENHDSMRMFSAFGLACRVHRDRIP
ncbi:gamma-glutamyl-gamma-aminobutyrate hydrolase family protein [Pseudoduganella sp. DS3]|uniref:gamma-glutamyl-gamma-aminobutyrate hydrolase n=1 Tax=Pseudoduganella guangdongensis TaxID=2692179 RepID=A0A6N9HC32_9BURK|nr:gamma-glutamyl-gamma-aminobutyrate hydrolase family protein [Pseudoduganella guangdongensis]MYN00702.1 gamma-glutamyl-gamma-aminobutyrate hydrolase family protein [Pseudoduganella guangdongensis]